MKPGCPAPESILLTSYILLLFLNKEMEQAGREADGRVA